MMQMQFVMGNNQNEAPVLNAYPPYYLHSRLLVAHLGASADLTYPVEYLGDDVGQLEKIASGKHKFAKILKKGKGPMIIMGMGHCGALMVPLSMHWLPGTEQVGAVSKDWNGFNMLHLAASRVAGAIWALCRKRVTRMLPVSGKPPQKARLSWSGFWR